MKMGQFGDQTFSMTMYKIESKNGTRTSDRLEILFGHLPFGLWKLNGTWIERCIPTIWSIRLSGKKELIYWEQGKKQVISSRVDEMEISYFKVTITADCSQETGMLEPGIWNIWFQPVPNYGLAD